MANKKLGAPTRVKGKASTVYAKVRTTPDEREDWQAKAAKKGFDNFSDWVRHLVAAA